MKGCLKQKLAVFVEKAFERPSFSGMGDKMLIIPRQSNFSGGGGGAMAKTMLMGISAQHQFSHNMFFPNGLNQPNAFMSNGTPQINAINNKRVLRLNDLLINSDFLSLVRFYRI